MFYIQYLVRDILICYKLSFLFFFAENWRHDKSTFRIFRCAFALLLLFENSFEVPN